MEFDEGDLHTRVTSETRLHEKAPFGVVSSHMLFECTSQGTAKGPAYTIDAMAKLVDVGNNATSALPDYQ
jgi:hypothetical protein